MSRSERLWSYRVKTAQGRLVPLRETVWMRTREVWLHAVDLDNGARVADIPEHVLERLLGDIVGVWAGRGTDQGLTIQVEGRADLGVPAEGTNGPDEATTKATVRGDLPAVVSWASGRGGARLTEGAEVVPPRWI